MMVPNKRRADSSWLIFTVGASNQETVSPSFGKIDSREEWKLKLVAGQAGTNVKKKSAQKKEPVKN